MPKKDSRPRLDKHTLNYAMMLLRELHEKGEIQALSEQHFIINTPNHYTHISFKIPKKDD